MSGIGSIPAILHASVEKKRTPGQAQGDGWGASVQGQQRGLFKLSLFEARYSFFGGHGAIGSMAA
jgi:hypothetical protein